MPLLRRFRAPDSRKPAWKAQRRSFWACSGDAVRTWRIYERLSIGAKFAYEDEVRGSALLAYHGLKLEMNKSLLFHNSNGLLTIA